MNIKELTLSEWGEALPETGFEVFHTPQMLDVIEEYTSGELRLLAGFDGDEPVALLPLFVRDGPVRATIVSSPPPSISIPHLGPILLGDGDGPEEQLTVNRRFAQAVLEDIDSDSTITLLWMVCSPEYHDPNPYRMAGLAITPRFTYQVDVSHSSFEDVSDGFSKTLRWEMRKGQELDVSIERGGLEEARAIHRGLTDLYEELDVNFRMGWEFLRDIVTSLGWRCRVYVARAPDGERLSGIVVLYSNDKAYYWMGGRRASYENISVNNLLHRRIIDDIVNDPPRESIETYDLVGANTERLCDYKSQFGGDLVQYYLIESNNALMNVAKRAYRWVSPLRA